ncbi:hypothetical protein [Pseudonocardia sp.]|uniref:hypothetical protein n=1 Tax=Pseudonocardia sp. TaxID=60912 RepID=UPI003D14D725
MTHTVTRTGRHRLVPRTQRPPGSAFHGVAFAVFAVALAIGALVHEWNSTFPTWVAVPVVVAAFAVLVRPASPARLVLLLGTLLVECLSRLPNPVNHQVLVGILGATLGAWWIGLRIRSPHIARDPAVLYGRIAPYLRVAFILTWAFAAFAKLNSGFTDVVTSCAVWILESVPAIVVPQMLAPAAVWGTIALELAIPVLLLFHRTRPYAIVLAFGFHAVSAFAGHSWFSGFAWAFYVLFLPPVVLARGVVTARRMLPTPLLDGISAAAARPMLAPILAGAAWVAVRYGLAPVLPGSLAAARQWGAVLLCVGWMAFTGVVLLRLRSHWIPAPGPRARLRVRSVVMWLGIAVLVVNAAMPYLGVKSRAAFTMFSNLRTEPGHWNHLIVPEQVRVFGWLDGGDVAFLATDDPAMEVAIVENGAGHVVLLGARRIAQEFPDATVRYTLDGVVRVASPVSADPVLGRPLTFAEEWYGAARPYPSGSTCQH